MSKMYDISLIKIVVDRIPRPMACNTYKDS